MPGLAAVVVLQDDFTGLVEGVGLRYLERTGRHRGQVGAFFVRGDRLGLLRERRLQGPQDR